MCTMIAEKVGISGSAKGGGPWFAIDRAYVSYDHPFDAPFEHTLNLDFVQEAAGPGARVSVELDGSAARALAHAILAALERAPDL
jgi:hypothetical protein